MITDLWPLLLQQTSELARKSKSGRMERRCTHRIIHWPARPGHISHYYRIFGDQWWLDRRRRRWRRHWCNRGRIFSSPRLWLDNGLLLFPSSFTAPSVRVLNRMLNSSLVTQATIDGDAGYEHVAEERALQTAASANWSPMPFQQVAVTLKAVNLT